MVEISGTEPAPNEYLANERFRFVLILNQPIYPPNHNNNKANYPVSNFHCFPMRQ